MQTYIPVLLSIIMISSNSLFSQESLMDSEEYERGKNEFKLQAQKDTPDYRNAYNILFAQVEKDPSNAELRYFLGHAIDRLGVPDGSTMYAIQKSHTLAVSQQFEEVIRLQPAYQGEIIFLDPYGKLTAIWGSLALAYLYDGKHDSAVWAFGEGKRRGGFTEPLLLFNRQLLASCRQNGILFTTGDNISFPCLYLQTVENFRCDISVVDRNLLHAGWYARFTKTMSKVNISFSEETLDTRGYMRWSPDSISIVNPLDTKDSLSWELKPTYLDEYILKGDRIALDILKQNVFTRDIYMPWDVDSSANLSLDKFLIYAGLVKRLVPNIAMRVEELDADLNTNLKAYNIEGISEDEIHKSRDAIFVLNGFRTMYYTIISSFLAQGEKNTARFLKDLMVDRFPLRKLPYAIAEHEWYFNEMFKAVE